MCESVVSEAWSVLQRIVASFAGEHNRKLEKERVERGEKGYENKILSSRFYHSRGATCWVTVGNFFRLGAGSVQSFRWISTSKFKVNSLLQFWESKRRRILRSSESVWKFYCWMRSAVKVLSCWKREEFHVRFCYRGETDNNAIGRMKNDWKVSNLLVSKKKFSSLLTNFYRCRIGALT